MSSVMGGIIGISLGVIIIVGIQAVCYKFIAWESYHKAVAIATMLAFLGALATLLIINIAK